MILWVEFNGPAQGKHSAAYAREWFKRFSTPADSFDESQATAGGQPAAVLSNLLGFARQRAAFVIAKRSLPAQPDAPTGRPARAH